MPLLKETGVILNRNSYNYEILYIVLSNNCPWKLKMAEIILLLNNMSHSCIVFLKPLMYLSNACMKMNNSNFVLCETRQILYSDKDLVLMYGWEGHNGIILYGCIFRF